MRRPLRELLVAFALVAAAVSAHAADTGTVSGAVFDQGGAPIADATVTIAGDRLPAGRTVVTGANGSYQVEYLPPGEYMIAVNKAGLGRSTRTAVVDIGKDTQVEFVLGVAVNEAVTVAAVTPLVDVRSTEVSFNFKAEALRTLPIERTYRGLFQLIPGVGDNRSQVGPAAGGSRQDNTYLMDGANITNPGFGYLGTEVNELDVAEVNLKRAGVSAEFGRTGGSVINAVSRSGSNDFSGLGRIDWLPESLVSAYALPDDLLSAGVRPGTFRDPLLTAKGGAAFGFGGPIARDRVFFYGSARYARDTKWDRINKVGTTLPDEVRTGPEYYGKITAVPVMSHQLSVSFRDRPSHIANNGINSDFAPTVAWTTDNSTRIASADWTFLAGPRALNVRYLHMKEKNEDVPVVDLGLLPPFDPKQLSKMGQYTDPNQANLITGANQFTSIQNYRRHETRATFSQFFNVGKTSHDIKAGAGYEFTEETFNRLGNGWGSIVNITQDNVPALRTRYFTPQMPQIGQGQTVSLFVQDAIAIAQRASVNAGVLLTRDDFSQILSGSHGCPASAVAARGGAAAYQSEGDTCDFLRFGFFDEVQPRLGLSYQLREGKGDKAYANWARYYNMDQKSSARSLAPYRVFQTQTIFDLNGKVLSSGPLASSTGKLIDPALKPIYSDELLFGYATPFRDLYSLDLFFVSRALHNIIEDVPSRVNGTAPDSGPFVAANLPCVALAVCRSANAERTYRAMTIELRRRLSRSWTADVNYTWSRFEGNYDLDYSTLAVFNTSSFIQDGPGTNVEDPNRFGPLFEDRPHLLKVLGSYMATSRLTASGYLRVQSGTPWAARARDWEGGVLNYLEPAGSHRNPTWANLDLMLAYRMPLGGRSRLQVEARALNVFNNQAKLSTDSQQFLDLRTMPTAPYFAPYLQQNPFFGTGNAFAPPRRLYLAAVVEF
jgi:Carboxypeptidase regulatory-like domain